MSEDLMQMTSAQISKEIKPLEDEGLRLAYEAHLLSHNRDADTKLFNRYEIWKINLLHLAEKSKNRDFELAIKKPDGVTSSFFIDMAFKENMPRGPIRFGLTDKDFSQVEMGEEAIAQISAMESGIAARMEALSNLRRYLLSGPTGLITIRVEVKDRTLRKIMPEGKDMICDLKRGRRLEFILKIMRSSGPVAAKKLGKNIQAISTNVRRVNKKVGTDLRLQQKNQFIVNPDERSGYRINDAYDVVEYE